MAFAAISGALLLPVAAVEPALITEARRAMLEQIPQAAIVKLQAALADATLGDADRLNAGVLLAEAQLNGGRANDALETLSILNIPADTHAKQLRALALSSLGRWNEALALFRELNATPGANPAAAVGEAESLQALGRTAEAVAVLERLAASAQAPAEAKLRLATLLVELGKLAEARAILRENPPVTGATEHWQHYIEARIQLSEKRPEDALATLAPLVGDPTNPRPAGLTQSLFAAAKLAEAEARLAKNGPDGAEIVLESFLRQNPSSPHLEIIFRRLNQIYALEQNPDENALLQLAEELPPKGRALARFYLCRMQLRGKSHERAAASLRDFLTRFPDDPLTPYVHEMLADTALAQGNLTGAEAALDAASRAAKSDELRGQFALRTALVNLAQGEFVRASTGFQNAARQSPSLKQNATYDAALAWLRQKNFERFEEELKACVAPSGDPLLSGNLRIEEGLVRARSGDPEATRALSAFLAAFPSHPRRAEAQIAFAELALKGGEVAEAGKLAGAVDAATASPEMAAQGEYLAVFIEDAKVPRDEERVITLARAFIARHPSSPLLGEVRMKLGEVYFRREDYLKAQEQFETLAREQPDGAHAAPALFLAGQSSMKLLNAEALKRALELFGKVADKHGPLEQQARLQQAIIKNKLGAPDDAVRIYDSILSSQQPLETELRLAALTGKGDNLVALGKADPKQFAAAIATYDLVAAVPGASPAWQNQAAYKKAKVLQQLEKHDAALTILYDVVNKAAAPPRETFWLAKAGFDAAEIAGSRQQWKSAVAIYEKMAAIPGPHADQAKNRAKTLRLEHFLWD